MVRHDLFVFSINYTSWFGGDQEFCIKRKRLKGFNKMWTERRREGHLSRETEILAKVQLITHGHTYDRQTAIHTYIFERAKTINRYKTSFALNLGIYIPINIYGFVW